MTTCQVSEAARLLGVTLPWRLTLFGCYLGGLGVGAVAAVGWDVGGWALRRVTR